MAITSEELANIAKAALATRGEAGLHPSVFKGRQALQEMRGLSPAEYNAALNDQIEQIGKTITGNIPGVKGTASIGHNAPNIWFTPPGGKPQKISRAFANEIPEGSTIHTLSKEDLAKQLGGYRRDPQKETEAAAALTVRDERRMADEAKAQKEAETLASLQERDVVGERERAAIVQRALDLKKQREAEAAAATVAEAPAAAAEAAPAATSPTPQPWGAPARQPAGLPPGSRVVPPAPPAYDPLKSKFPLSTELSLYAAPPAALAYGAYMTPSPEERLQKKLLTAVQAGQPSEDINPNEGDIDAALKIARERALEAAYSREGQNSMLGGQNAWRAVDSDLEPGYTTPGAAAQWSDVDMRPQLVARPASSSQMTPRSAANIDATSRVASRPVSSGAAASAPAAASSASPSTGLSGFLSNIFANRPVSTRDLFEQSSRNPEDAGAWMRAERQYAKTHPSDPSFDVTKLDKETGMKRGGAAGNMNGKDAALHKALDIIHAMMTRGHH